MFSPYHLAVISTSSSITVIVVIIGMHTAHRCRVSAELTVLVKKNC